MTAGKNYTLPYARKREVKTDYAKRLALIKSGKPRLVVRRALNNITAQLITYHATGDKTLVTVHSRELVKHGWKAHRGNLPSAYLTGLLLGLKAKKANIHDAVLDIGLSRAIKGSALFATVKGVIDAGIHIPHSPDILPPDDRILGKTIATYAQTIHTTRPLQFSRVTKQGLAPAQLPAHIAEIKQKILTQWK